MEYYVGQIQLFPYNFAPKNWTFCEGQLLSLAQYLELFAVLGKTYGGDGQTTFALPDLRGKEPIPNLHYCIAILDGIPPSEDGG
jgi:microcystin-dependent protein